MEYVIIVTDDSARAKALAKALEAYNSRNTPVEVLEFMQKMVDQQLDSLVASYLTVKIDVIDFLDRFTVNERVAIRTAAKSNAAIDDYLQMLNAAPEGKVNLTSERTVAGVHALESAQLIGAGRAAEILAL